MDPRAEELAVAWQMHGIVWHGMAWHGTARRCGCACAFWGNLNLGCWVCQDGCQGPKAWGEKDQNNPRTPKRFPRVLTSRPWSNQKWDQIVSDTRAGQPRDRHNKHQPIQTYCYPSLSTIIVRAVEPRARGTEASRAREGIDSQGSETKSRRDGPLSTC